MKEQQENNTGNLGQITFKLSMEVDFDALGKLIKTLQERDDVSAEQMPLLAPYRLDDCGWVANRWCELLPMPPELKQRLMELDNPLLRLELVSDILERTGISG